MVYGGTSAGLIAGIEVAQSGHSVVVIEPSKHVGGLSSNGLGATDVGNKDAIGGLAREFYSRIRKHYAKREAWVHEKAKDFRGRGHVAGADAAWTFEPKVAEAIFEAWIREARLSVVRGERLDLNTGVVVANGKIERVRMESGRSFRARVFIDASYEGDLLAKAGVRYVVGREANAEFGETLNGVQTRLARAHQFVVDVSPYVQPGKPGSGLLAGILTGPGIEGAADRKVQAYCFRICATDVAKNRVPWPKPKSYDERAYELLLRNFEAGDLRRPWHPVLMPNRKTDSNNNFAVSTDFIGANWAWPEADYATRERIFAKHLEYQQGLFWTLANHERVPRQIREYFANWGLAKDEFVDHGNWPRQLYVREGRRMRAAYVMSEHDCRGSRRAEDSVGLGAYGMDSHHVQRYVDARGFVRNEGDVQIHGFSPYPISYRALVPRREDCRNLLVPVCVSATHIAFGSIRMEPVFMLLGQSSAVAAVLALESGVDVQDVRYERLRGRLLARGQVLRWTGPTRKLTLLRAKDLPGVVVDDVDAAELHGEWLVGRSAGRWVGQGYGHDRNQAKGQKRVVYRLRVPRAGTWELRMSYSAHRNRAQRVPVEVVLPVGPKRFVVDQTREPAIDGLWHSLGRFELAAGSRVTVTISNRGTKGHVIADAVQLVRAEARRE